ncbi:NirA family protein [Occallatibacter riparius]|uniref:NirA family protein n=1 Tax=Occallatibacter riparius TaxID=1002689 RepID=A0A9J7BWQ2_9BACT|nr:NirA family protein [Occallatibacter riparius]UWZ86913.1 NirA family protein [Occallatibacter riparius]
MESTSTYPTAFTSDQKEYLAGFFTGVVQQRFRPFAGMTPEGLIANDSTSGAVNLAEAVEETYHGVPVSDLCREERWKAEENPLDIWEKLLAHADANRAPAAEDLFRFKFHGLFYVAPAQDSFMLRLRIPGGRLTSHQMRGLADMAERYGSGRADLTTRANMQIREFQPRDIVRVLNTVQSLGLTSRGTGADNIRNITASPTTGIDPSELLDVSPLAEGLHYYILNSRDMYELPRKFNVAFDSGGSISVLADTNDIGFQAVRVGGGRSVPAGIYFRVLLCGITGHCQFAEDTGLLILPEQAVAVAAAMIRVFIENGDRTDRKKARLKYLVDRWGVEKFIAETEKRLAFPLLRCSAEECDPRNPIDRAGHIGVHPQRQPDLHYIGISVPVGRLPVEQMRAVAAVADQFGTGEIRLTVWQNLLIPNVHSSRVSEAVEQLREAGLDCDAGAVLRGTVACTGNRGCRYAATDTKSHAVELANFLDARFQILQPVNLHVTGCPHSCAQHCIGDIGLLGTKVMGEEGYQVVIGGGADKDQGIARELISAISYSDLPPLLEQLFRTYVERRAGEESFLDFSRRHTIDELKSFLVLKEAATR